MYVGAQGYRSRASNKSCARVGRVWFIWMCRASSLALFQVCSFLLFLASSPHFSVPLTLPHFSCPVIFLLQTNSFAELIKVLQCTPNLMFLGVRDTDEVR